MTREKRPSSTARSPWWAMAETRWPIVVRCCPSRMRVRSIPKRKRNRSLNILMCNERFLFRFGMDRTLILLGQHLTTIGHRVSAMAHQGDRAVLEGLFSRVIDIPVQVDDYLRLDELTAAWLETAWNECFAHAAPPEVVVVGGWPFFSAIPFL